MDKIIKADYFLRAKPKSFVKKIMRAARRGIGMFALADSSIPSKESKYKVVLIGGYGHFDIGDEAMPHAVRNNLRGRLGKDIEIVMLSPNPENTRKMHGENSALDFTHISHGQDASILRKGVTVGMTAFLFAAVLLEKHVGLRLALWPSTRTALDQIQSADVILNVGGGNINSVIPSELYRKTSTFIIADILRKPVYVSGQTMGPFHGWIGRRYSQYALDKVQMISFRDKDVSHNRLSDLGVNKPVMFDAADDAITLQGIDSDQAKMLIEKETGLSIDELKKNLLIVLNMKASLNIFKGKGRSADLGPEIKLMARLADYLIEKYSCKILLMPTDFTDTVDDRVPHRKIFELIRNKNSTFQITGTYVDDELIGMIGLADIAIGTRYHFHVFAASRHIPFVGIASGIYQRTKLQGLARLCGLDQCYIDQDMEFVEFEDVWPAVIHVIENRNLIASSLSNRVPYLKKNSVRVVDEVVSLLQSGKV